MLIRNQVSGYIRDSFKLEGRARAIPTVKLTSDVMRACKDKSLPEIKKYIDDNRPSLTKKLEGYVKSA